MFPPDPFDGAYALPAEYYNGHIAQYAIGAWALRDLEQRIMPWKRRKRWPNKESTRR